MAVKAYAPIALALIVAFASMYVLAGWREIPHFVGFVALGRFVPMLALAGAMALFGTTTWRLLRWERGLGPMCHLCGGPLGRVRDGVRDRGDYRRCLACGKAVNNRHYE